MSRGQSDGLSTGLSNILIRLLASLNHFSRAALALSEPD